MNGYDALAILMLLVWIFRLVFYSGILYLAYKGVCYLYSKICILIKNKDKIKPTLKWTCSHKKECLINTYKWIKTNKKLKISLLIVFCFLLFNYWGSKIYYVPPLAGYVYDQDGKPLADANVEVNKRAPLSMILYLIGYPDGEYENRYSPVKTNAKGYYQTKAVHFIASKGLDSVIFSIEKQGYSEAETERINHCFDYNLKEFKPDEKKISLQIKLSANKIYNHDYFSDNYFFINRKNVNCYIAESWQVSLSGKHDAKNPVIVPNLTLFENTWKTFLPSDNLMLFKKLK